MSRIQIDEVREIAALARLALADDEIERMTKDLDAILEYVETLRQLDTAGVEPMTHAVPFDCPLRPDEQGAALAVDEALRNATRREQSFFEVPRAVPVTGAGAAAAAAGPGAGSSAGSSKDG